MRIGIINGPNLNLLGKREPDIYGSLSLKDIEEKLAHDFAGLSFFHFQSNIEGELISKVQEFGFYPETKLDAIIINPGGFSHTSVALADSLAACTIPVVEVHLSNIYAREEFRHKSLLSGVCKGIIAGFGLESYALALDSFAE